MGGKEWGVRCGGWGKGASGGGWWKGRGRDVVLGGNWQVRGVGEVYGWEDAKEKLVKELMGGWRKVMEGDGLEVK